jgi:transposase
MTSRTVGIDLAIRGAHIATVLDAHGAVIGTPLRFHTTYKDLKRFVRVVRAGLAKDDRVLAIMEPTGMSWFPIAQWLARAGCTVIRVKGQRVKALRRYLSEHAKTDVLDARLLSAIPGFGQKGLSPLYLPSAPQMALNRLTKQRRRYQEETGSIMRRLRDLIRWAEPDLEDALPELNTMVSLAVIERYFDPRAMRRLGQARLVAFLDKHVGGTHAAHGPFTARLAERLMEAARSTIHLYPSQEVDFELLQLEVEQEVHRLRLFQAHIDVLDEKIEELYKQLHPADHLRSLPGVGNLLGPSLLAVIHDPRRFGNARKMRGYTGLFPRRNESGGIDNPSQRIVKSGNDRLKRDLILAADIARRFDPDLGRVYFTMMVEKGKHHKQALCAVANRLTNRIHAVLKEGRPYVLRDLEGRAITVPEGRALVETRFKIPAAIRAVRRRGSREAVAEG